MSETPTNTQIFHTIRLSSDPSSPYQITNSPLIGWGNLSKDVTFKLARLILIFRALEIALEPLI